MALPAKVRRAKGKAKAVAQFSADVKILAPQFHQLSHQATEQLRIESAAEEHGGDEAGTVPRFDNDMTSAQIDRSANEHVDEMEVDFEGLNDKHTGEIQKDSDSTESGEAGAPSIRGPSAALDPSNNISPELNAYYEELFRPIIAPTTAARATPPPMSAVLFPEQTILKTDQAGKELATFNDTAPRLHSPEAIRQADSAHSTYLNGRTVQVASMKHSKGVLDIENLFDFDALDRGQSMQVAAQNSCTNLPYHSLDTLLDGSAAVDTNPGPSQPGVTVHDLPAFEDMDTHMDLDSFMPSTSHSTARTGSPMSPPGRAESTHQHQQEQDPMDFVFSEENTDNYSPSNFLEHVPAALFTDAYLHSLVIAEERANKESSDESQASSKPSERVSTARYHDMEMSDEEARAVYSIDFPRDSEPDFPFKDTKQQAQRFLENSVDNKFQEWELPKPRGNLVYERASEMPFFAPPELLGLPYDGNKRDAAAQGRRAGITFKNIQSCLRFRIALLEAEIDNGLGYVAQKLTWVQSDARNRTEMELAAKRLKHYLLLGRHPTSWSSSDCTKTMDLEAHEDRNEPILYDVKEEMASMADSSWKRTFHRHRKDWSMELGDWFENQKPPPHILSSLNAVEVLIREAGESSMARQQTTHNLIDLIKACNCEDCSLMYSIKVWTRPHWVMSSSPVHQTNPHFPFNYPHITRPKEDYADIFKHEAMAWLELKRDVERFARVTCAKHNQYETSWWIQSALASTQQRQDQMQLESRLSRHSLGLVTEQQFLMTCKRNDRVAGTPLEADDDAELTGVPITRTKNDTFGASDHVSVPGGLHELSALAAVTPTQAFKKAAQGASLPSNVGPRQARVLGDLYKEDLEATIRITELFNQQLGRLKIQSKTDFAHISRENQQALVLTAQKQTLRVYMREMKDARFANLTKDYLEIDHAVRQELWKQTQAYVNAKYVNQSARMALFQDLKQRHRLRNDPGETNAQIVRNLYAQAVEHGTSIERAMRTEHLKDEIFRGRQECAERRGEIMDAELLQKWEQGALLQATAKVRLQQMQEMLLQQAIAQGCEMTAQLQQELLQKAENRVQRTDRIRKCINEYLETIRSWFAKERPHISIDAQVELQFRQEAECQATRHMEEVQGFNKSRSKLLQYLLDQNIGPQSAKGQCFLTVQGRRLQLEQVARNRYKPRYGCLALAAALDDEVITKEWKENLELECKSKCENFVNHNLRVWHLEDEALRAARMEGPVDEDRSMALRMQAKKQLEAGYMARGITPSRLPTPVPGPFPVLEAGTQHEYGSFDANSTNLELDRSALSAPDAPSTPVTAHSRISFKGGLNGSVDIEPIQTNYYSRPGGLGGLDGNDDSPPRATRARKTTTGASARKRTIATASKASSSKAPKASAAAEMGPPSVPNSKPEVKAVTKRQSRAKVKTQVEPEQRIPTEHIDLISPSPEPETLSNSASKVTKGKAPARRTSAAKKTASAFLSVPIPDTCATASTDQMQSQYSGYAAPQYTISSSDQTLVDSQLMNNVSSAPKASMSATSSQRLHAVQQLEGPTPRKQPSGSSNRHVKTVAPGSPLTSPEKVAQASAQTSPYHRQMAQNIHTVSQLYRTQGNPTLPMQNPYPVPPQFRQARNMQQQPSQTQNAQGGPIMDMQQAQGVRAGQSSPAQGMAQQFPSREDQNAYNMHMQPGVQVNRLQGVTNQAARPQGHTSGSQRSPNQNMQPPIQMSRSQGSPDTNMQAGYDSPRSQVPPGQKGQSRSQVSYTQGSPSLSTQYPLQSPRSQAPTGQNGQSPTHIQHPQGSPAVHAQHGQKSPRSQVSPIQNGQQRPQVSRPQGGPGQPRLSPVEQARYRGVSQSSPQSGPHAQTPQRTLPLQPEQQVHNLAGRAGNGMMLPPSSDGGPSPRYAPQPVQSSGSPPQVQNGQYQHSEQAGQSRIVRGEEERQFHLHAALEEQARKDAERRPKSTGSVQNLQGPGTHSYYVQQSVQSPHLQTGQLQNPQAREFAQGRPSPTGSAQHVQGSGSQHQNVQQTPQSRRGQSSQPHSSQLHPQSNEYFHGQKIPFTSPTEILTPGGQHPSDQPRVSQNFVDVIQNQGHVVLPSGLPPGIRSTLNLPPSTSASVPVTPIAVHTGIKRKATGPPESQRSSRSSTDSGPHGQAEAQAQDQSQTRPSSRASTANTDAQAQGQPHGQPQTRPSSHASTANGDAHPAKRQRLQVTPEQLAAYEQHKAEQVAQKAASEANVKRMEAEEGARHRAAFQQQAENDRRSVAYESDVEKHTADIKVWQWESHGMDLFNMQHSMPALARSGSGLGSAQNRVLSTASTARAQSRSEPEPQFEQPMFPAVDHPLSNDPDPYAVFSLTSNTRSHFAHEMDPKFNYGFFEEGQNTRFDGAYGCMFDGAVQHEASFPSGDGGFPNGTYQSYGRIMDAQRPSQQDLERTAFVQKSADMLASERKTRLEGLAGFGYAYSGEEQREVLVRVPVVPKGLRVEGVA